MKFRSFLRFLFGLWFLRDKPSLSDNHWFWYFFTATLPRTGISNTGYRSARWAHCNPSTHIIIFNSHNGLLTWHSPHKRSQDLADAINGKHQHCKHIHMAIKQTHWYKNGDTVAYWHPSETNLWFEDKRFISLFRLKDLLVNSYTNLALSIRITTCTVAYCSSSSFLNIYLLIRSNVLVRRQKKENIYTLCQFYYFCRCVRRRSSLICAKYIFRHAQNRNSSINDIQMCGSVILSSTKEWTRSQNLYK